MEVMATVAKKVLRFPLRVDVRAWLPVVQKTRQGANMAISFSPFARI